MSARFRAVGAVEMLAICHGVKYAARSDGDVGLPHDSLMHLLRISDLGEVAALCPRCGRHFRLGSAVAHSKGCGR